jgi:hypothetical protein
MFNADFDPYDMLINCHNALNHQDQTIKKLIKHIQQQDNIITELAEGHARLSNLHQQNTTVIKGLVKEISLIKNNASN